MGVLSSDIDREVRMERMRPAQLDAAIASADTGRHATGTLIDHLAKWLDS